MTDDQADDESGELIMPHQECVTASSFDSMVKKRSSFAPPVSRFLYGKHCLTAAMRYGHHNEAVTQEFYIVKQLENQCTVPETKPGLGIDYLISNCWRSNVLPADKPPL